MATDLDTDNDGRLYADEFGDFGTVSADANVKAQIKNAVSRGLKDVQISPLDGDRKRQIRQNIRTSLTTLSYVDHIVATKIHTPTDDTIRIEVQTQSENIRFDL